MKAIPVIKCPKRSAPMNLRNGKFGEFYGSSYFVDPKGQFVAKGSTDKDELVIENISKFKPKYVFFPHWSWIIPE